MSIKRSHRHGRRQSGISLIELVMSIVIVSVGLAGIISVMNVTSRSSADPMVAKQALAIAESVLEEVQLQPFTYCDPDDPAAATASGTGACSVVQGISPSPATESRYADPFFDNVGDYGGFAMNPFVDRTGAGIAALSGYATTVAIANVGATVFGFADPTAAVQIDVRVTVPGGTSITLTGYRLRYAPNAVP